MGGMSLNKQLLETPISVRIREVKKAWFAQVYPLPRTPDGYKLDWTPPELTIFEDRVEIGSSAENSKCALLKYPYMIVDGEVLF